MKAKVQKIDTTNDPHYETAEWDEYVEGEFNSKSPPVDYSVTGEVKSVLEEGNSMVVFRDKRNGKEVKGIMRTSPIQSVKDNEDEFIVETQNSVYLVEKL